MTMASLVGLGIAGTVDSVISQATNDVQAMQAEVSGALNQNVWVNPSTDPLIGVVEKIQELIDTLNSISLGDDPVFNGSGEPHGLEDIEDPPVAPTVNIPVFSPSEVPEELNVHFFYEEGEYPTYLTNVLVTRINQYLSQYATEEIWERNGIRLDGEYAESAARLRSQYDAFNMPGYLQLAGENRLSNNRDNNVLTGARAKILSDAELSHQMFNSALSNAVSIEETLLELWNTAGDRLLKAAEVEPLAQIEEYKANIERLGLVVAQTEAYAKQAMARAKLYKNSVEGFTARIKAITGIIKSDIGYYKADNDVLKGYYEQLVEEADKASSDRTNAANLEINSILTQGRVVGQIRTADISRHQTNYALHKSAQERINSSLLGVSGRSYDKTTVSTKYIKEE